MRIFVALSICTAVLGCDMMRTEQRVEGASALPIVCTSNAGSYSLPKSLIKLKVAKEDKSGTSKFILQEVEQVRSEDRLHTYCLGYRGSITADDKIFVRKAVVAEEGLIENQIAVRAASGQPAKLSQDMLFKKTNLLQVVSTEAIDQSSFIAQRLIKSLYTFGTGSGRDGRAVLFPGNTVLDIEFDPFQPYQMAAANEALNDLGFCAILGGYSFDISRATIQQYCNRPSKTVRRRPPIIGGRNFHDILEEYQAPLPELPKGILYRPEMTYSLYIFGKSDPDDDSETWRLRIKQDVQLENISPIVAVRMNRTYFASRQTNLVFVGGVLKNVCISKSAPLVEAVKIPLVVVKSIVAVPAEILQLRINSASNKAQLIEAQQKVLTAQLDHLKALSQPTAKLAADDISASSGQLPLPSSLFPDDDAQRFGSFGAAFKDGAGFACPQPAPFALAERDLAEQNPGQAQ